MTQFFSSTSSTLYSIRSTDDIFENIISPKDVRDFFIFHHKRLWIRFRDSSESWTFESTRCEIKATPGERGNVGHVSCIGCSLTCRLFLTCTFPKFSPDAKIYKIEYPYKNIISTMNFHKRPESESKKFEDLFMNNATLTFLLDDIGSGGGILFCYKCCGSIILCCEATNDLGYGFGGIIKAKRTSKLSHEEVNMFVKRLEGIDKILKDNNFFFKSFSDEKIAITNDACGSLSVKLFPTVDDKIYHGLPDSEFKSLKDYAVSKGILR